MYKLYLIYILWYKYTHIEHQVEATNRVVPTWVTHASRVSPLTYHCTVIEGAVQYNARVNSKFTLGINDAKKVPPIGDIEFDVFERLPPYITQLLYVWYTYADQEAVEAVRGVTSDLTYEDVEDGDDGEAGNGSGERCSLLSQ